MTKKEKSFEFESAKRGLTDICMIWSDEREIIEKSENCRLKWIKDDNYEHEGLKFVLN